MTDFQHRDILNIKEAAARAKAEGMNISEYTLRRIIRTGKIPCRIVGRTYLISCGSSEGRKGLVLCHLLNHAEIKTALLQAIV